MVVERARRKLYCSRSMDDVVGKRESSGDRGCLNTPGCLADNLVKLTSLESVK